MSFSSFLTGANTRAFDRVKDLWEPALPKA
jgi:hypothetical protein